MNHTHPSIHLSGKFFRMYNTKFMTDIHQVFLSPLSLRLTVKNVVFFPCISVEPAT